MSITPVGSISKSLDNAERLLAASTTFQSWVGAANATDALNSIWSFGFDISDLERPCCRTCFGEDDESQKVSSGQDFWRTGEIVLVFEDDILHECSIVQTAGTATLTQTAHGFVADDVIQVRGASEEAYNGEHTVLTAPDADTLTFAVASDTDSPATGSPVAGPRFVDFRQCFYRFMNKLGAIYDEICALSGTDTYLNATRIKIGKIRWSDYAEGNVHGMYIWGEIRLGFEG